MVSSLKPIKVTSESSLVRLLRDAEEAPVLLERDGLIFRLSRENADLDAGYAPDAALVRRTLDATAGTWADLSVDQLIEDIYNARRDGSRTPERS